MSKALSVIKQLSSVCQILRVRGADRNKATAGGVAILPKLPLDGKTRLSFSSAIAPAATHTFRNIVLVGEY